MRLFRRRATQGTDFPDGSRRVEKETRITGRRRAFYGENRTNHAGSHIALRYGANAGGLCEGRHPARADLKLIPVRR
jgi:hypothetical protein